MRKLLLTTMTLVGFSTAALAADLPLPAPPPPPPPVKARVAPPQYTPIPITFYFGGQGGVGSKGSKNETVATCIDPLTNTYTLAGQDVTRTNTKFGIHGGFEVPMWVMFFGVEGYGNWSLNNYNVMAGFVNETGKVNDYGIDAVIGFDLWNSGFRAAALLGYGQFHSNSTSTVLGSSFNNSGSAGGFQWGLKADYLLDRNWAVLVEWRQTNLDQIQVVKQLGVNSNQKIGVTDNTVTAGVQYRFTYGESRY